MTNLNRITISLSDEELAALDCVRKHYGFSRSRMLAKLILQSMRTLEEKPKLEEQLAHLEGILAQFEASQSRIVGDDKTD